MIAVYIASPYTKGDVGDNVNKSMLMADYLEELGFLAFTPLLSHFRHLVNPRPYEYWLDKDLEWLKRCDCVLRMEGESNGADQEVAFADLEGIPVFYSVDELVEQYGDKLK